MAYKINPLTGEFDITGTGISQAAADVRYAPIAEPLSLHLDQTTPQTFTGGTVTGSGLLKSTSGQLGLDTTTAGLAASALQNETDPIVVSQANGFTITRGTTPATLTVAASGSVSGTNTGDNAANSSSTYIGTTSVALNRASAALTLAGITLTTPDIGTPSAGVVTNFSGTASININGTVGATTPTTGKFTTVELNATSGHIIGGDGTTLPYNNVTNGSFETWTGLTDVLVDGGMETWTNPTTLTNWTLLQDGSSSINKESTIVKQGTYSAKLIRSGGTYAQLYQIVSAVPYRNKTMVAGVWMYATVANKVSFRFGTNEVDFQTVFHSGSGAWEYFSIVGNVSGTATGLFFNCQCNNGDATGYFDGGILYEKLAPTGWALAGAGATVAREEGTVKVGTYSAKLTRNGADAYIYQSLGTSYRGKTLTAGVWVYQTVANRAYLTLTDSVATTINYTTTTINQWVYLSGSVLIDVTGTAVVYCQVETGDTTAYFDGATVNEGSMPYAFSEPPVLTASNKSVTVPTTLTATLGDITATNGNFKIGTADKGIDFSANSNAAGMTSELFNDYEIGTWTPSLVGWTNIGSPTVTGTYTKIGRMVYFNMQIVPGTSVSAGLLASTITGLPFSAAQDSSGTMVDANTGASFGAVYINATTIYPQTTGVTSHYIDISGCYNA